MPLRGPGVEVEPMDCSLPGSSIYGIFQARVLERGALQRCENQEEISTRQLKKKQKKKKERERVA